LVTQAWRGSTKIDPFRLHLSQPIADREIIDTAVDALQNDRYVLGENVLKFEEEFARYVGTDYAISMSSGTSALTLTWICLGLDPGKEVLTTPFSYQATADSIIYAGGKPRFADISMKNYNLDPHKARKANKKTVQGIQPVHLYGHPADIGELRELCDSKRMWLVEDCCQAHGAKYQGKKVGSLGDAACFSFYPSKNMTVLGDGGITVTNSRKLATKISIVRNGGRISHYRHSMVGVTSRLNSINAAIGRVQLRRLDEWNQKRRELATLYQKYLGGVTQIGLPPEPSHQVEPVYHIYAIRTKRRNQLKAWLEKRGIECGVHYPIPIHLQPAYRKRFGYTRGSFPLTESMSASCLSLPMHPNLSADDVMLVADEIKSFFQDKRC
jgi:perosamine synthetase